MVWRVWKGCLKGSTYPYPIFRWVPPLRFSPTVNVLDISLTNEWLHYGIELFQNPRSFCGWFRYAFPQRSINFEWNIISLHTVWKTFSKCSTGSRTLAITRGSYHFEVAYHFRKNAHPKWSTMVQNGLKLFKMIQIHSHFLPTNKGKLFVKMTGKTDPS